MRPECPLCKKRYADAPRLKRHHETVHLKLRPHECNVCGKRFGTSGDLRRHARTVHDKERRFGCELCPMRFSRGDNMHEHMRAVHRAEPLTMKRTSSAVAVSQPHSAAATVALRVAAPAFAALLAESPQLAQLAIVKSNAYGALLHRDDADADSRRNKRATHDCDVDLAAIEALQCLTNSAPRSAPPSAPSSSSSSSAAAAAAAVTVHSSAHRHEHYLHPLPPVSVAAAQSPPTPPLLPPLQLPPFLSTSVVVQHDDAVADEPTTTSRACDALAILAILPAAPLARRPHVVAAPIVARAKHGWAFCELHSRWEALEPNVLASTLPVQWSCDGTNVATRSTTVIV